MKRCPECRRDYFDDSLLWSGHGCRVDKRLLILTGLVVILVFAGFAGYRYLNSGTSEQIVSIAVMPFANEDQNPDLEYLSDGMTDTIPT